MSYNTKGTKNLALIIGRLGADPELASTPQGVHVMTINLATNSAYKDQQGNSQELTEWHRCVLWRKAAEVIAKYAKKGMRLYVEGKLKTSEWEKDGQRHFTTEIHADTVQMLEAPTDNRKDEQAAPDGGQVEDDTEGDSLPF